MMTFTEHALACDENLDLSTNIVMGRGQALRRTAKHPNTYMLSWNAVDPETREVIFPKNYYINKSQARWLFDEMGFDYIVVCAA